MELPRTFLKYLENPPPGSALARAIAAGVDPTMTFHLMYACSPADRLRFADRTLRDAERIAGVIATRKAQCSTRRE
jgi:hypothetical protein